MDKNPLLQPQVFEQSVWPDLRWRRMIASGGFPPSNKPPDPG